MKVVASLVASVLILYLIAVNFSASETAYACKGTVTGADGQRKVEVYVRLKDYRFWVGLWSKSDGDLWIEMPGRMIQHFAHLQKSGDIYGVFDSAGGRFAGNFSTLSRNVSLKISESVAFEGKCSPR